MTVRQVFYALTVRGVVAKTEAGYRQVQRQVLLMRREGVLPWAFIADGTRWVREPETWDTVDDALQRDGAHVPAEPLAVAERPARVLAGEGRARVDRERRRRSSGTCG